MNQVETVAKVRVYERNGHDLEVGADIFVTVKTHWNRKDMVVLKFGSSEYAVSASDLCLAIGRCSE